MKVVKFFMKSGNVIEFECSEIEITRNGFGVVTGYDVTHGDSKNRLICSEISRIEGITIKDIEA